MSGDLRVGIIGASGYAGTELLRLSSAHPDLDVQLLTAATMAGRRVADVYPAFELDLPEHAFVDADDDLEARVEGLDLVFLGLPHAAAMALAPRLVDAVKCVVDLSAAFRLDDAAAYPVYYGFEHTERDLLAAAVYGLPEFHRAELSGARLIATPGCHVTAAALALRPLVAAGLLADAPLVVDTLTGITGAGRAPSDTNVFANIDANAVAYGLLRHRHTPEMEQEIGTTVLFTPHLVPMSRGLLATCHGRIADGIDDPATAIADAYASAYAGEPFVGVIDRPPSTKATLGANTAYVSAVYDDRTGSVIAMCALDNLTKGAAGGALQAANVALGLDETAGLPTIGLQP